MPAHLIIRLDAPLMAFGDTMIDAIGRTRDLPNVSSITGLIANALGWTRGQRQAHQRLQDRLIMGARLDRVGTELFDYQTARLFEDESGWTTQGKTEGRAKSPSYSKGPTGRKELTHQRFRFYRADAIVTVALRLEPANESPTLADIESAFNTPARPLFIGRKPCLPSVPLLAGNVEAETVIDALLKSPLDQLADDIDAPFPVVVPAAEVRGETRGRTIYVTDRRNWISGVHAGESELYAISLPRSDFSTELAS